MIFNYLFYIINVLLFIKMSFKLTRCLTNNKISYAESIIDELYDTNTNATVLIQLERISDDEWNAHYIYIDENGKRFLKQDKVIGRTVEEIKKKFVISLIQ